MVESSRNNAGKTPRGPGRRFAPGNPGRPKGARHKATVAAEVLLDGEAEKLTRKAVELALAGDTIALRLCLDRILSPRRERPISFALPKVETAADAVKAVAAIAEAVAAGEITPGEAGELTRLVDVFTRTLEATEFEARLTALEQRASQ